MSRISDRAVTHIVLIDGPGESCVPIGWMEGSIDFWFLVGGVTVGCAAGGWTGGEY